MFQPLMYIALMVVAQARASQAQTPQAPTPQTQPSTQAPATQQAPATATQTAQAPATANNTALADTNPAAMFVKPMTVAETTRLAITPNIDGKIDPDEWDSFSTADGVNTYFQWAPGRLYFAAEHVPQGQDLIISIDGHGDSWLVGRDNLEVRVHWQGNDPQVTERILDNTPVSGPAWTDATEFKDDTEIAGSSDATGHTVEIKISDPNTNTFPERAGSTAGIRFDVVPEGTAPPDPYLARVTVPVRLQFARGEDIPAGLSWKPEVPERSVIPGDGTKLRLTFTGNDDLGLKRIDMRTEGLAANDTTSTGVPFPKFDKRGRAFVDYKTTVSKDADLGYRVMKATIVDGQGKTSTLETSYEIAPVVSFDFHDKTVAASNEPQDAKFSVIMESHTEKRIDAIFRVQVPDGWKVKDGDDSSFIIYYPRGDKRQEFTIVIPGGFKGVAPIKLIADFNGSHAEQTEYITVQ